VFGTWLVGALVFFRQQWESGFTKLMGNDGDTRLAAYLCEHWFRVFHGQGSWLNPTFFYPVKEVLGWSDTFLVYEIFYAPLRLLGCDPFLALQITMILFNLIGFCSFVYLVRLAFDTPLPAALFCACIFTFANALWLHSASAQFYGIYLVPAILLLGLVGWRSFDAHPKRAAILAFIAGLMWALLLYSTYYIGWDASLALGLTFVLVFVAGGRPLITRAVARARAAGLWLAALALGFVAGIIPVLRTYLPNQHRTTYAQVMQSAAHLRDLVNVGPQNVFWSHLAASVDGSRLLLYEDNYAVTPIVLALTFGAGVIALGLLWSNRRSPPPQIRMTVALAATALILFLLPVNTRFGSLWVIVWHLPGGNAMRAIDRIQLITGLAAILAIAASTRHLATLTSGWRGGRALQLAGLGLLAIAVAEQANTFPVSLVDHPAQTHFLDSIKAPPSGCRTFFVVDTKTPLAYFEYQVDAMLVSQKLSLPTVNGYTGHFPKGWGLLLPNLPSYPAAVSDWATEHGLASGMCSLDLATLQWHVGD
jgi:hypothetical protein